MKPFASILFAAVSASALFLNPVLAHDTGKEHDHDHDHDHDKIVAGPNGGRVLMSVEPHLEFFVMDDGKIKITPLDEDNKTVVALGSQSVRLTGGDRTNPTRLSFVAQDGVLISEGTIPDSKSFPVVVQIKVSEDADTVMEKFQLNMEDCPTCDYKEYACTCDHHHDHDHEHGDDDHDHKHEEDKK